MKIKNILFRLRNIGISPAMSRSPRGGRGGFFLLALPAIILFSGCSHSGKFVWVDDIAPLAGPTNPAYVIAAGDVLSVRVWGQDTLSARTKVRLDGKISLPFLNDVDAAGYTPDALAERIKLSLKDFILKPMVTVALEETKPFTVSVVGEVSRPGVYTLEPGAGVLHALASAGGITDFAGRDRIYVLRTGLKSNERIRFKYQALAHAEGRAATFTLQVGDIVVVE